MTAAPSLSRTLLWLAAAIFLVLQASLWFGEGGIFDVHRLKSAVAVQQAENLRLRQRNNVLEAEVNDLKTGHAAIEERARLDLGMIKDDETFYLVTGKALSGSAPAQMPATPVMVHSKPGTTASGVNSTTAATTEPPVAPAPGSLAPVSALSDPAVPEPERQP
ncbi:MAG: cell division protein FtsB [Paraperlucidibaca sp.]